MDGSIMSEPLATQLRSPGRLSERGGVRGEHVGDARVSSRAEMTRERERESES